MATRIFAFVCGMIITGFSWHILLHEFPAIGAEQWKALGILTGYCVGIRMIAYTFFDKHE